MPYSPLLKHVKALGRPKRDVTFGVARLVGTRLRPPLGGVRRGSAVGRGRVKRGRRGGDGRVAGRGNAQVGEGGGAFNVPSRIFAIAQKRTAVCAVCAATSVQYSAVCNTDIGIYDLYIGFFF